MQPIGYGGVGSEGEAIGGQRTALNTCQRKLWKSEGGPGLECASSEMLSISSHWNMCRLSLLKCAQIMASGIVDEETL